MTNKAKIYINRSSENNLKNITVAIPHRALTVITGISGSGKSTLAYNVIAREGMRRFYGNLSANAQILLGKLQPPNVESIENLLPVVAVDQHIYGLSTRSTVGTITGLYDQMRLLFARTGKQLPGQYSNVKPDRSLFSFNTTKGACPSCKGLGVEDYIDQESLVGNPDKSLRQGALVLTTPKPYIIYSQVTMEVLDQVCHAEGFSVDIPWKELTVEQKKVVLYGTTKLKVPFGKHTLESRMKWTGITAKPREEGYYRGIIPVMEEILQRDRNPNILRFTQSRPCSACQGARLRPEALSIAISGRNIHELSVLSLDELSAFLLSTEILQVGAAKVIVSEMLKTVKAAQLLGLGHLEIARNAETLSSGELKRLKLVTLSETRLQNVCFVLDEPTTGLHPRDTEALIGILNELVQKGNTVVLVEHDPTVMKIAHHLIDLGPMAGEKGGELLFSGPPQQFINEKHSQSPTWQFLSGARVPQISKPTVAPALKAIELSNLHVHNLKHISVSIPQGQLTAVTGVSGAGKSTLLHHVLAKLARHSLGRDGGALDEIGEITGLAGITRLVEIDQRPIGKTSRSNPATYTGLMDMLRDLFGSLPEAKARGFKKSHFSFNVAGGRCETCLGAGKLELGLHFLGTAETTCTVCNGKRFKPEVLEITYNNLSISDLLNTSIEAATHLFAGQPSMSKLLQLLCSLGCGYLKLGQSSDTLSGGEAQRIKLATELFRQGKGKTLYLLDEPTTGLHQHDTEALLNALFELTRKGHTVVCIEHNTDVITNASWVVDLGPGSGKQGGNLIFQGQPDSLKECAESITAHYIFHQNGLKPLTAPPTQQMAISLKGVSTHNLKNIDLSIETGTILALAGISGSGKTSLAYNTLFTESNAEFSRYLTPYVRSRLGMGQAANIAEASGLTPTIAIRRKTFPTNSRSTVGTYTGIYDLLRLIYSRVAESPQKEGYPLSTLFSFNHEQGGCPACGGLGSRLQCTPQMLIVNPEKPLNAGVLGSGKVAKLLGDPYGKQMATLATIGKLEGVDFFQPWNTLSPKAKKIALEGAGSKVWEVEWNYKRGKREGSFNFSGKWDGLVAIVNEEYSIHHLTTRGAGFEEAMERVTCSQCGGKRLNSSALSYKLLGMDIAEMSQNNGEELLVLLPKIESAITAKAGTAAAAMLCNQLQHKLKMLTQLGIAHLSINRESHTLSTGEQQKLRLLGIAGVDLAGITYILDEPFAGLDATEAIRIKNLLSELTIKGNTVVLIDHSPAGLASANRIVELGPDAGEKGGTIVFDEKPEQLAANRSTATGLVFSGSSYFSDNSKPHPKQGEIVIIDLNGDKITIPANGFTAITGPTGSGKSTLLLKAIGESVAQHKPVGCRSISLPFPMMVVHVNEVMGGSSSYSTVSTQLGISTIVRKQLSLTEEARKSQLTPSFFGTHSSGGRCEACAGTGVQRVALDLMPDYQELCESCNGTGFTAEALNYYWLSFNIAQWLEMSVEEAHSRLSHEPSAAKALQPAIQMGIGYLRLRQTFRSLSTGEQQRLHLASAMVQVKGKALFVFDEPTIGLHPKNIADLRQVFEKLLWAGHTIITADQNPSLVNTASHLIILQRANQSNKSISFCGLPFLFKTLNR